MQPVEELMAGIYLVRIPLPGPLQFLNAYLLRGPDGWALVDTGFHEPETEARWEEAFARLGIGPGDLEAVVVTHAHADHVGAAGWLQQRTGAPVLMLDREVEAARHLWEEGMPGRIRAAFVRHGMPAELAEEATRFQERYARRTLPRPHLTPVREGETLRLGGRRWEVLWCPGHTDGLMVLWCPDDGVLLANDMVLATITPNVQRLPGLHPDPLDLYLGSLERVGRIPARIVLTGHRQPVTDLAGRTRQIREHHDRRLARMRELAGAGATAWQVCAGTFGRLETPGNLRFAMAETLAHLYHLGYRGALEKVEEPGEPVRWRLPGA